MIEGLDQLLGTSQPALTELRQALEEVLGVQRGKILQAAALQLPNPRAYRLRIECNGVSTSLIVKRLEPVIAHRNHSLLTRWLPAVGLAQHAPKLLGAAAAPTGLCVWHVYEDLADYALNAQSPLSEVKVAIELVAKLHLCFASHPLLAEARLNGGELGSSFFAGNIRDAIHCLERVRRLQLGPRSEHANLCEQLLARLDRLSGERAARTQALEELGGPETLLHGDLWITNVFVVPAKEGLRAKLIDWDHVAAGPISYDLSTLLTRFPSERRLELLEMYREAVAPAGWRLPGIGDLNRVFETAEYGRYANCIIWPVLALLRDGSAWGWEALAEVEQWFREFRPILPEQGRSMYTAHAGILSSVASPGSPEKHHPKRTVAEKST